MSVEATVGEQRKFTFSIYQYTVREILENTSIHFFWSTDRGICPHCKNKLVLDSEHVIYYVEILGREGVTDKDLTRNTDTLVIIGHSLDKRILHLSEDKLDEVFALSKKFRHLIKEVK